MLLWWMVLGCTGGGEPVSDCPAAPELPDLDEDGFYYASACPDDDEELELGAPRIALDGERVHDSVEDALAAAAAGSVITICDVQSSVVLEISGSGECPTDVVIEGTGLSSYNATSGDTVRIDNATVELAGLSIRGTGVGDAGNAVRAIDSTLTLRDVIITNGDGDDPGGLRAVNSEVTVIDSDIRDELRLEGGAVTVEDTRFSQRGRVYVEGGDASVVRSEFSGLEGGQFGVEVEFGETFVSDTVFDCVESRRGVKMDGGGRVESSSFDGCAIGVAVESGIGEVEDVQLDNLGTAVVADYSAHAQCLGSTQIAGADVGLEVGGFGDGSVITGCDVSGARIGALSLGGGGLQDLRISGSSEAAIRHVEDEGTFDRVVVEDNDVSEVAPILMVSSSFVGETDPSFLTFTDCDIVGNSTSDTSDKASNGVFVSEGSTLTSTNSNWLNGSVDVVVRVGAPFHPEYIAYEVGGLASFFCEGSEDGYCE